MGLLDGMKEKVKNLFTEEVEVDEPEERVKEVKPKKKEKIKEKRREEEVEYISEGDEIQKEVIQVEIPSPVTEEIDIKDDIAEPSELEIPTQKEEYKFPFFDDDDFDMVDVPKKEEPKRRDYHDVYNPPKEEKKSFKPSPIISPVYGFLDKNYQKEELVQKKNDYTSKRASVDEIRDKAYGSLESDLETTLFGNTRVLFDDNEKKEVIEDTEENKVSVHENEFNSHTIGEKPRHEKVEEDDLTELLEAEIAKSDYEEEKNKKPRKISDKELFNLIDSMYEKEQK